MTLLTLVELIVSDLTLCDKDKQVAGETSKQINQFDCRLTWEHEQTAIDDYCGGC
jgi:hypothetical protein